MPLCLARLSSDDSRIEISKNHSITYLSLCKREACEGKLVCGECSAVPSKASEFSLRVPDGSIVYRRVSGHEFQARYNKVYGTLVVTEDQPIPWNKALPTVFTNPTHFAKTCAKVVHGLDKVVYVNGWDLCFVKDDKGKTQNLQKVRGSGSSSVKGVSSNYYGLLSEPFPKDCNIYGSPGFWKALEKKKQELPTDWIEEAEEAEEEAKRRCAEAGVKFYEFGVDKVQAQSDKDSNGEMPKKPLPKAADLPAAAKITNIYKPIEKFYYETPDEPVKLVTDTQRIWIESLDEEMIWRCETGFVFKDADGKPGKLIGKYIGDDLKRF